MGASELLPQGFHLVNPVASSFSVMILQFEQSHPAKIVERTEVSAFASAWLSSCLKPPIVGSKPLPVTSYMRPPAHIFTMVILPSVSVPVLSEQITDADPSVSTAARRRTSTFWCTMAAQPMEREMVTQSGMPSGIAATARVTDTSNMYMTLDWFGTFESTAPRPTPTPKTIRHVN